MRTTNGIADIRHLDVEEQGTLLRSMQAQKAAKNEIDATIYLLSKRAESVLERMGEIRLGLHDIDGTHTTVGGHRLFHESALGLRETRETGMRHIAVTGRHEGQVRELMQNQLSGPPHFEQWLIEQGFFRIDGQGNVEFFEGTEAIAQNVLSVRGHLEPLLSTIQEAHDVTFETTSLRGEGNIPYPTGAHRTMYSVDASQHGRKIEDRALHGRIADDFTRRWTAHDPEFRIATPRTSSTGTFEFTPDGVNKAGAVLTLLNELKIPAEEAAYFGDSRNDLPVYESIQDLGGKFVMVNGHTDNDLIRNADIATVGINPRPILRRIADARNAVRAMCS